jgi:hypothetical protein
VNETEKNGGHPSDIELHVAEIRRRQDLQDANISLCLNYVRELAVVMGVRHRLDQAEQVHAAQVASLTPRRSILEEDPPSDAYMEEEPTRPGE